MGWLSGYYDRASVIRDVCKEWVNDTGKGDVIGGRTLKKCLRGNVLWTVREIVFKTGPSRLYIGCDLLKRFGKNDWGYKDMDEGMHPYYYTCPQSFLETVTKENVLDNAYNEEWREHVKDTALRAKVRKLERARRKKT